MCFKKRLFKEVLFFVAASALSFLLWFALALITEQKITAPESLYVKELLAFIISIGVFYIIRLSVWL